MGSHPINLALRFILELIVLGFIGYYGYKSQDGFLKYVLMLLLPIIAAAVWGVFAVPNDPSRSGKTVIAESGILRLLVEALVFGSAAYAMYKTEHQNWALIFTVVLVLHYIASYDRVMWLLDQK